MAKAYELTIEKKQPTCGGRAPTACEVRSVTTDDPMAYVRSQEPGADPVLMQNEGGVILIRVEKGEQWVNYESTED